MFLLNTQHGMEVLKVTSNEDGGGGSLTDFPDYTVRKMFSIFIYDLLCKINLVNKSVFSLSRGLFIFTSCIVEVT